MRAACRHRENGHGCRGDLAAVLLCGESWPRACRTCSYTLWCSCHPSQPDRFRPSPIQSIRIFGLGLLYVFLHPPFWDSVRALKPVHADILADARTGCGQLLHYIYIRFTEMSADWIGEGPQVCKPSVSLLEQLQHLIQVNNGQKFTAAPPVRILVLSNTKLEQDPVFQPSCLPSLPSFIARPLHLFPCLPLQGSGPEDFSHLPPEQRRKKLQSKLDDINKDIQKEMDQRYFREQIQSNRKVGGSYWFKRRVFAGTLSPRWKTCT